MSTETNEELTKALDRFAGTTGEEPLDRRLESAIDTAMDRVIVELAKELAGKRDAKMYRSRAARALLRRGALALREDRIKKARRAAAG